MYQSSHQNRQRPSRIFSFLFLILSPIFALYYSYLLGDKPDDVSRQISRPDFLRKYAWAIRNEERDSSIQTFLTFCVERRKKKGDVICGRYCFAPFSSVDCLRL